MVGIEGHECVLEPMQSIQRLLTGQVCRESMHAADPHAMVCLNLFPCLPLFRSCALYCSIPWHRLPTRLSHSSLPTCPPLYLSLAGFLGSNHCHCVCSLVLSSTPILCFCSRIDVLPSASRFLAIERNSGGDNNGKSKPWHLHRESTTARVEAWKRGRGMQQERRSRHASRRTSRALPSCTRR